MCKAVSCETGPDLNESLLPEYLGAHELGLSGHLHGYECIGHSLAVFMG